MATIDGKTFGKFEVEWAYDLSFRSKGMTYADLLQAVVDNFPELTQAEAAEYTTLARKARRKEITSRSEVHHYCYTLVKNAGGCIQRDKLIDIVMGGWRMSREEAAEYIDAAIENIPDPGQVLIVYDSMDDLREAIERKVGKVEPDQASPEKEIVIRVNGDEDTMDLAKQIMKAMEAQERGEVASVSVEINVGQRDYVKRLVKREAPPEQASAPDLIARPDTLSQEDLMLLGVFEEGRQARDTSATNPYRGNTIFHCLHAAGWVQRDLERALASASNSYTLRPIKDAQSPTDRAAQFNGTLERYEIGRRAPGPGKIMHAGFPDHINREGEGVWQTVGDATPRHAIKGVRSWQVGSGVEKVKGYRFPGEVIAEFKTRKGKLRYVVEGIGDGNDECLHIFSADDLVNIKADHGWVYRINGQWRLGRDVPDNAETGSIRPATEAEKSFWKRA